jgi:hypothetical protein
MNPSHEPIATLCHRIDKHGHICDIALIETPKVRDYSDKTSLGTNECEHTPEGEPCKRRECRTAVAALTGSTHL